MKKSLIALAALATAATAAQAQSSVTVYGIVDSGYLRFDSANDAGAIQAVASGALSTSRLGFKGTEDLGGGLKANFTLENQFATDTGAQSGDLFTRGAWIQLDQANLGSITLGRQNRLDYVNVIAADPTGAANIGGFVSMAYLGSGIISSSSYARVNNAVTLQSANIAGFTAAYQHSFGEAAGDQNKDQTTAARLTYTYGQLNLSAAHAARKNAVGTAVDRVGQLFANYDFGIAKAFVGYQEGKTGTAVNAAVTSFGVVVPVNTKVTVTATYHDVKDSWQTAGGEAKGYGLIATYALSKRTTAYAAYANANVNSTGKMNPVNLSQTVTQGKDANATAVGIRHTF